MTTGKGDENLRKEPIRFFSGSFSGAQVRWSTIEKEAYEIYWALGKLDDQPDMDQPVNSISEIDLSSYALTNNEGTMFYGVTLLQKLDTLTLTSMARGGMDPTL